jgi:hypothetical protein
MSTVSDVASIAPSHETTPSLREQHRDRILPAPFTELPFDVYVITNPLVPGKENLDSVGTFEFTAKFGRPLYVEATDYFLDLSHLTIVLIYTDSMQPIYLARRNRGPGLLKK